MTTEGKGFDLDLDDVKEVEEDQVKPVRPPRNVRELHKAKKKDERGPLKNQTYTMQVKVIEELRVYVFKKKLEGATISASRIVNDAVAEWLKKHG